MEDSNIATFRAVAQGRGWPTEVRIFDTEWTLKVDEPIEDGGSNTGPNPMQYFIASLTSCQNEQSQVVAEELSLNISQVDIKAEIDLDLSGFMGMSDTSNGSYKNVRLDAVVSGEITTDQVKNLGQIVDERCPILALLRTSGCSINSNWNKK